MGITQLLDVYSKVLGASMNNESSSDNNEEDVVVIDSDDLAANPRKSLKELCVALRIDYRDSMLTWESGPHKCDGPWGKKGSHTRNKMIMTFLSFGNLNIYFDMSLSYIAKWWYHDVWESSGWDITEEDDSKKKNTGVNHPRTQKYRTIPSELLQPIRISIPAYNFLQTLTTSHKHRAITTPPSGKLYEDPRNEYVLVYVGTASSKGRIVPRDMAAISPFDSSVQGGDATWGELIRRNVLCFGINALSCNRMKALIHCMIC